MYCSNCKTEGKVIVEEDDTGIYYHCFNCDMADEEYKTDVNAFIDAVQDDYDFQDVQEFADEHFQNLASLEDNIKDFIEWVELTLDNG